MNRKFKKISKVRIVLLIIIVASLFFNKVSAADLAVSANGNNVTISSQYTGNVQVTVTGGSASESSVWLENNSQTITISNVSENGATVTVTPTGQMSDDNGTLYDVGAKTVNIAGNKKKETPSPVQPSEPAKTVQQDPTFTNTNKTMYTNGDVNLRASWSTSSKATPVNKGTELTVTGTSTESVNGYVWYRVSYNGQTKYIASGLLTSTKPEENKDEDKDDKKEKSTNKALKGLVVENHKLSPEFDPETTKYTLEVTKDVEKLEITPILQDDKSKFEITGNENFKVGNNIVKITVTAEDGTNRIYTITVTKTNEDGTENPLDNMLKLKKLQIKDIKLDPEFNPETTNYSILVSDPSSIKIADITAVAEDEDVEVTIAEAEADKNGNRVITIMLENKEGDRSGVYQVTIKKGVSAISELQRNKNNRIYFILGGIIGILAIAIIVVIILLKKTSDDGDDYDDIKDADELSDDYDYALKREIDIAKSEEAPEFDEIIEDSNVKSQILSNQDDYNAFEDKENDVKESNTGVSEETKRYDFNGEDEEEDFKIKGKKKGKHF